MKIEALEGVFPDEWIDIQFPLETDGNPTNGKELIGFSVPYLDKGFVQLIDYMGDDRSISEGARASFRGAAYDDDEKNRGLINYLVRHQHTSPVELPVLQFRTKIPLFVRAQHIRHRTQSCNWESHRYSEVRPEFYVPPLERIRLQDEWNKQGSGEQLESEVRAEVREAFINRHTEQVGTYQGMIERGVSRETARGIMSTSFYTTGVWSMKLRNLFHYLKLRTDPHAQAEIQLLAGIVEQFTAKLFPMAYEAWKEFEKGATSFSEEEMEILTRYLSAADFKRWFHEHEMRDEDKLGGSKGRVREFLEKVSR